MNIYVNEDDYLELEKKYLTRLDRYRLLYTLNVGYRADLGIYQLYDQDRVGLHVLLNHTSIH